MPLLRRGITGFALHQAVEFQRFKQAVYAAAQRMSARVISTKIADGVTPNFHQADMQVGARKISVICSRCFPIVACVESPVTMSGIRPIDAPDVVETMLAFGFEVADSTELERAVTPEDLEVLSEEERKQLKYWKSQRIGDLVFNWWD